MHKLKSPFIKLKPKERIYNLKHPVIALTGGISTGKSSFAKILKTKGFKVIDADQLVKKIYQTSESLNFIKNIAPELVKKEKIDFKKLREAFFSDTKLKTAIEEYIYSKLPQYFLSETDKLHGEEPVFYDIPLLYEKKLQDKFDLSIVVYIPEKIQLERLILRDKISKELALKILNNQMSIEEKKARADFVIDNTRDKSQLEQQAIEFLNNILENYTDK